MQTRSITTPPPPHGMLFNRTFFPSIWSDFPENSPVPIYIPTLREALWEESVFPKNTT